MGMQGRGMPQPMPKPSRVPGTKLKAPGLGLARSFGFDPNMQLQPGQQLTDPRQIQQFQDARNRGIGELLLMISDAFSPQALAGEPVMQERALERRAARETKAQEMDMPTTVQEFLFAKQTGFEGGFADFLNLKKTGTTINVGGQDGFSASTFGEEFEKTVAKDLGKFAAGGFAAVETNLNKLEDVLKTLETENVTGVFQGTLPDLALTLTGQEKAVAVRNDIESIIFQSLKETLGAQFTEREAERLIRSNFNPLLSEEENAKRIRRLRDEIKALAEEKKRMADYARENNGLSGYQGRTDFSTAITDISKNLDNKTFDNLSDQELVDLYNKSSADQKLQIQKYIQESGRAE